jgi:hypothetical protein
LKILYLPTKIDIEDRFDIPLPTAIFEGILIIVDGTECRIQRPNGSVQRVFYSGKKKCHTIKYEIGVRITDGKLLWINGPYPGKTHDKTMLEGGDLCSYLLPGETLLGDKGYQGHHQVRLSNLLKFR